MKQALNSISNLAKKGLVLYEHTQNPSRFFLVMGAHADDAEIHFFIHNSKHIQIFADRDAWTGNLRPGNELHQRGEVIVGDLSTEGIKDMFKALDSWELYKLEGWNRMALRAFPRGDLFVKPSPESYIFEALSHLDSRQKFVFVSEINVPWTNDAEKENFLNEHSLAYLTQPEIIKARISNTKLIANTGQIEAPLKCGDLSVHSFYSPLDRQYHWAFTTKDFGKKPSEPPLVRIESECLTGHMLGSLLCDCGHQLEQGLQKVKESGNGALLYLRQEGRGIGLLSKLRAYKLQQEEKLDTVDANLAIGEPEDARDYLIGALMLKHFKVNDVKLMTNNPAKVVGLEKYGLNISERVSHVIPPSKHNEFYLSTKKERMGHII